MKNKFHALLAVLIASTMILAACGSPATPAVRRLQQPKLRWLPKSPLKPFLPLRPLSGTISVSGAFALYPMMTVWAEEFTKLHPDVQFDVQGGGAGKGMTDTIAGAVDIGMISRSIKPEEEAQNIFWVSVTKDAVFPIISD